MAEATLSDKNETAPSKCNNVVSIAVHVENEGSCTQEFFAEKDDVVSVLTREGSKLQLLWSPRVPKTKHDVEDNLLRLPTDKVVTSGKGVSEQKTLPVAAETLDGGILCSGAHCERSDVEETSRDVDADVQQSKSTPDSTLQMGAENGLLYADQNEDADLLAHLMMLRGAEPGLIDLLVMDDFMLDEDDGAMVATYPLGIPKTADCLVCFQFTSLTLRPCCAFPVCNTCLRTYFETQVSEAKVKMACLSTECSQSVHRDEILALLSVEMKLKFSQFLVDANKEPHKKTCPRCSSVMTIDLELLQQPVVKKSGLRVECSECSLVWCFPCQAPWHEGMKCKDYRRGDKLVKTWARERPQGQVNAQKCPKCKVFIQRSSGCDHMTCTQCNTQFCYQCGEKYREFKFIGNHHSRLSIFGCKYLYKHDKPAQRKFIRGSIFGAKLLAAPVLGGLALGAGAVVAGIGLVVLPFYGGYKLHKKLRKMKEIKNKRQNPSFDHLHHDVEMHPWSTMEFRSVLADHFATADEFESSTIGQQQQFYGCSVFVPAEQDRLSCVPTISEGSESDRLSVGQSLLEDIDQDQFCRPGCASRSNDPESLCCAQSCPAFGNLCGSSTPLASTSKESTFIAADSTFRNWSDHIPADLCDEESTLKPACFVSELVTDAEVGSDLSEVLKTAQPSNEPVSSEFEMTETPCNLKPSIVFSTSKRGEIFV